MRQQLADGVSGNHLGLWLLAPEHLRLGTWDMLCGWTGRPSQNVEPRLAMQLLHEAALCVTGIRQSRCLRHRGFELANGLPFVATDQAIHDLLDAHTIAEAEGVQVAMGRIRHACGHYKGRILAIDPHRLLSHSNRRMRVRKSNKDSKAAKTTQTFFCLDADTCQPLCMTIGTSGPTVSQTTGHLLDMAGQILPKQESRPLVLADCEHFTVELVEEVYRKSMFDLIVPTPGQPYIKKLLQGIDPEKFVRHWAGMATAKVPYAFGKSDAGPFHLFAQRSRETPGEYGYKGFLCTADRDEVESLSVEFPKRWHIEEFFNANQDLGWKRAGTQNMHIRYGQMTMALLAQASIHQLRQRLAGPAEQWNAKHLAKEIFCGLDGGLRVHGDTVVVTYYNAPNAAMLREHFEGMPKRLEAEGVSPEIPWLYNLKLDFRFK